MSQWAAAVNMGLFAILVMMSIGIITLSFHMSAGLRKKGERLAVVEERLRQMTMTGNRDQGQDMPFS